MIKCNFTDIRNSWEMNDPVKIDGNWCDIKCLLIKTAAKCEHYCSDIIYDINWLEEHIKKGEDFITHELFYECGVHATSEYLGQTWTEEQKIKEMRKHCSKCFCIIRIEFKKVFECDYELTCEIVEERS